MPAARGAWSRADRACRDQWETRRVELSEVVRRRRMVRSYTDEPVDPTLVERALEHATRAPSAGFSQGWAFVVLDRPEDRRRFWAASTDDVDRPDRWLAGMMRAPARERRSMFSR